MVIALIALFASLSGTTFASILITSNKQVAQHTIAGAKAAVGMNRNIVPGSLGGSDVAPHTIAGAKAAAGVTQNVVSGSLGASDLANGILTATQFASGYKDGPATRPSLRTLGTGPRQAAAGNDPRLSQGVLGSIELCPGEPAGCDIGGPLPVSVDWSKVGTNSHWLIMWSATGYRTAAQGPGMGQIDLLIDGTERDWTSLYFNRTGEHLAFPSVMTWAQNLDPGPHTIQLVADGAPGAPSITTDSSDRFHVSIVEVDQPA
jgi:hypothetical protein